MVQSLGALSELQDIEPAEQENVGQAEAQEGESLVTESQEEQDYKALYEQEKAAREKSERDHRAQDIQRATQMQRDARNALMEKTVLAIANRVFTGATDDKELPGIVKDGLASFRAEEESLTDVSTWVPAVEAKAQEILAYNTSRGWTMASPEMAAVKAAWDDGVVQGDKGNTSLAKAHFDLAFTAFELVKFQHPSPGARNGRQGSAQSVNAGGGRVTGGGMTPQMLVNKAARGEPMTPDQIRLAGEALDRGIYPNF